MQEILRKLIWIQNYEIEMMKQMKKDLYNGSISHIGNNKYKANVSVILLYQIN